MAVECWYLTFVLKLPGQYTLLVMPMFERAFVYKIKIEIVYWNFKLASSVMQDRKCLIVKLTKIKLLSQIFGQQPTELLQLYIIECTTELV